MEWLYQHEDIIDVLFGSVSLLTMFVVILLNYRANLTAERAIQETVIARELENRPYLYFHMLIEQGGTALNFELVNQGNGIARNIRFSLDQDLKVSRRREKVSYKEMAIAKPFSFLAPGNTFKEYAEISHIFFQDNEAFEEVTGKIEYEDGGGKKYFTPLCINLKALGGRRFLVKPGISKLVQTVEQIHRVIQRKRK